MLLELRPRIVLLHLPLLLLLSEHLVDIIRVDLILRSSFIVLLLRLLENLIEFERLLVKQIINRLFQCLL